VITSLIFVILALITI